MENENVLHTHDEIVCSYKDNEILLFAIPWINMEDITLSERSQTLQDKYCMVSLICGI
jgi:hypothetical protein